MLFHTAGQAQVFLSMLYAGLLIGLWYDALGLIRRALFAGRLLTATLDLVFGAGSALILIAAMLLVNYGEMRVYCLLGALCGAALYAFTLRRLLKLILARPYAALTRLSRWLGGQAWVKRLLR